MTKDHRKWRNQLISSDETSFDFPDLKNIDVKIVDRNESKCTTSFAGKKIIYDATPFKERIDQILSTRDKDCNYLILNAKYPSGNQIAPWLCLHILYDVMNKICSLIVYRIKSIKEHKNKIKVKLDAKLKGVKLQEIQEVFRDGF